MRANRLLTLNAFVFIAFGIAFALYGPVMLAFFKVPELSIDSVTYWHLAAFARMFGAALFSLGLLLWSLRKAFIEASAESRRGVLFALLLGNLMCGIVSITQQSSIWMTPSGWVTAGIFFILTLAYAVLLARPASYRHA